VFSCQNQRKLKETKKLHKPPKSKRTRMTKTTTGTRSGDSKLHISSNCETLAFTGTTQGETKTSLALKGLRKEAKTGGGRFSSPNIIGLL